MSASDIANIYASINNLQNQFDAITGNTLSNYNQLSRIVSQQGNIYNALYFGTGNIVTRNINFTGNLFQNGVPYGGGGSSQWTTLNGNIYFSSGNVGIKKTTPNFELDVNGNVNLTGNLFQNGSPYIASQWTTSGSNIYYNLANGNVGIGTINPLYKIDINGSANVSSNVYCMNMFVINDCLVQGGDFSIMNGNLTVYKQFNTFGESVLNGNLTVYNADFFNYGNSYVYNGLYLNKNGALYTNGDTAGQHAFYSFDTVNLMSTLYGGADDTNRVGYFQARGYGGGLPLLLNPNGGNVGVGTGVPRSTLSVSGNAVITGNVNIDNGLVWTDPVNNRVGINNTNPQFDLDVNGNIARSGMRLPRFDNNTFSGASSFTIPILFSDTNYNYCEIKLNYIVSAICDINISSQNTSNTSLSFFEHGLTTVRWNSQNTPTYTTSTNTSNATFALNVEKDGINNNVMFTIVRATGTSITGRRNHYYYDHVFCFAGGGASRAYGFGYINNTSVGGPPIASITFTCSVGTVSGTYSTVHSY